MAIRFYPEQGQILNCDFLDLRKPEITKRRPVVVISPRLENRGNLVAVVPLSTTLPRNLTPYIVQLSRNYHPTRGDADIISWAKCDIVMTVALRRLDRFLIRPGVWVAPKMRKTDFEAVKSGVLYGLGFAHLIEK